MNLVFVPAGISFATSMAAPMAPVTSWFSGTVIFLPVTFSKADTTPRFAAVPPWKNILLPMRLSPTTLLR